MPRKPFCGCREYIPSISPRCPQIPLPRPPLSTVPPFSREPRVSHICSPSIIVVRPARWKAAGGGRGSICNQTERSSVKSQEEAASPMPVGRGSDDEEACLRHSTPPTGTLMQAACKHTPHMYLSVWGGGGERRGVGRGDGGGG